MCTPPIIYVGEVWNCSMASVESIKKATFNFNINKAFECLSIDTKVKLLNETLLSIFQNYIPSKKIKSDYRQPSWMNYRKTLLKEISKLTKYFHTEAITGGVL